MFCDLILIRHNPFPIATVPVIVTSFLVWREQESENPCHARPKTAYYHRPVVSHDGFSELVRL
jgi:hypothetical protein